MTYEDVFPGPVILAEIQPMLPEFAGDRRIRLKVDKVRIARAWVSAGAEAQCEVFMVRDVIRQFSKQSRTRLCDGTASVGDFVSSTREVTLLRKPA